jgi:hypothetical protein
MYISGTHKQKYAYIRLQLSLFGWLVADGWCWFVLREEYCWLVAGGWFDVREKYCWLVADKPNEHGVQYINSPNLGCYLSLRWCTYQFGMTRIKAKINNPYISN